jgi:hypothetical protein
MHDNVTVAELGVGWGGPWPTQKNEKLLKLCNLSLFKFIKSKFFMFLSPFNGEM